MERLFVSGCTLDWVYHSLWNKRSPLMCVHYRNPVTQLRHKSTHNAVVLPPNSISHLAEADFRPRPKVNASAAVGNFFSPEKELGSEQHAEQANFTSGISRCDITGGREESTAHFHHTLVELVIARTHKIKCFYLYLHIVCVWLSTLPIAAARLTAAPVISD